MEHPSGKLYHHSFRPQAMQEKAQYQLAARKWAQ